MEVVRPRAHAIHRMNDKVHSVELRVRWVVEVGGKTSCAALQHSGKLSERDGLASKAAGRATAQDDALDGIAWRLLSTPGLQSNEITQRLDYIRRRGLLAPVT